MKREFLKNLGLTDEQVNQIMTENGNDIEKYRKEVESKTKELETLNTKYESAQNSLNDANKQIKSYKDMDIEGIKNSAAEWEKKYKDETAELNKKLTQQERDFATNSYFAGMNFTSESAKRGIISQFKEQNFELKDGKFIGADEYINGLKESDAGAFVVEKTKDEPSLPTFTKGTASKGAPGGENNANAFGFHFAGVRAMPKE